LRGNRYLLFGLMIVLVFTGIPNVECNDNMNTVEIHPLDVGGAHPPSIGWMFSENATVATGVHIDSVYVGETERTWPYTSQIFDSDGVDTVFFQYRHNRNNEWMNRTPSLISGDSTDGQYSYTFVQKVWYDWESHRAEAEGGGFTEFRIFANDSLGNWRTTMPTFHDISMLTLNLPWHIAVVYMSPLIAVFGIIGILSVAVLIRRRKRGVSQESAKQLQ